MNRLVYTSAGWCQTNKIIDPLIQENPRYHDKPVETMGAEPVVYYSTLMSVACGKSGKEAGLDGQVIKVKQLEEAESGDVGFPEHVNVLCKAR